MTKLMRMVYMIITISSQALLIIKGTKFIPTYGKIIDSIAWQIHFFDWLVNYLKPI